MAMYTRDSTIGGIGDSLLKGLLLMYQKRREEEELAAKKGYYGAQEEYQKGLLADKQAEMKLKQDEAKDRDDLWSRYAFARGGRASDVFPQGQPQMQGMESLEIAPDQGAMNRVLQDAAFRSALGKGGIKPDAMFSLSQMGALGRGEEIKTPGMATQELKNQGALDVAREKISAASSLLAQKGQLDQTLQAMKNSGAMQIEMAGQAGGKYAGGAQGGGGNMISQMRQVESKLLDVNQKLALSALDVFTNPIGAKMLQQSDPATFETLKGILATSLGQVESGKTNLAKVGDAARQSFDAAPTPPPAGTPAPTGQVTPPPAAKTVAPPAPQQQQPPPPPPQQDDPVEKQVAAEVRAFVAANHGKMDNAKLAAAAAKIEADARKRLSK